MITPEEEKYLLTIPETAMASVVPYDPRVSQAANRLIDHIKKADEAAQVLFMGAAALQIAGQNDIDLYILSLASEFGKHLPKLISIFGQPTGSSETSVKWARVEDGFDTEIYLTDPDTEPMQRQIRVFELLRDDDSLKREYEQLKIAAAGLSLRDYQRRKYEFYNRILV